MPSLRPMYTYISVDGRVHDRERAVYEPCTRPFSAVYMACTRPCTRHVHVYVHVHASRRPLHGRERAAHRPCTRMCTRPCTAVHTARVHCSVRAMHSAVYTARTLPCNGIHGKCTRIQVYTAVVRPCTRPVYRPLSAVDMLRTRPCKCRIYGPCTRI